MNRKISFRWKATTMVEMLIVIIVSGILFLVLFDGVTLIKRYTFRLTQTFSAESSLLDSYCRLDRLLQRCDSMCSEENHLYLYWKAQQEFVLTWKDSILSCDCHEIKDTLFRKVTAIRLIPVERKQGLVDSLIISVFHKGAHRKLFFGLNRRSSEETEKAVEILESKYD